MYLAAVDDGAPARDSVEPGEDGGRQHRRRLWRQVRAVFPDLTASALRLEESGGDHLLLIADEARVFRFARSGTHGPDLEIELLRHLARAAPVAVPDYDLVDPDGRFASYRLIAGVPLTAAGYAALPPAIARRACTDAVGLLVLLHGVDPAAIAAVGAWPRMWSADDFATRLRNTRLPVIARQAPGLVTPIEAFLRRYRDHHAPTPVVLHGDLVGDHLLVDARTGRLTGVIDFSDIALGDPAHDFMGFWAYGAGAATAAITAYGRLDADPTLLARSRDHHIRYEIDRLFEVIGDGIAADAIQRQTATLARLLAEPPGAHPTLRR